MDVDMHLYLTMMYKTCCASLEILDAERKLYGDAWGPAAWRGFAKRLARAQGRTERRHKALLEFEAEHAEEA